jgi:cytochrome P450
LTLCRDAEVRSVLSNPCFVVPPVQGSPSPVRQPAPPIALAGDDVVGDDVVGDDVAGRLDWLRRNVSRFSNGPVHDRRRGLVLGELSRMDPASLRRAAHDATTTVLGRLGGEPFDVMSRLARAVPLGVLGAELGVGARDLDTLVSATAAVAAAYHPSASQQAQDLADAAVPTLMALLGSAWCGRSGGSGGSDGPGRSGGSSGSDRRGGSDRVDGSDADLEAVANRIGLLVQACDATAGLIGNAVHAALRLSADPLAEWSVDDIIAETLRFNPPVRSTRRQAIAGARWGGEPLPLGTIVVLDFAAANRDAAAFVDPRRADLHCDRHRADPHRADPHRADLDRDPHCFDPGRATPATGDVVLEHNPDVVATTSGLSPQNAPGAAAPGHLTFGYGLRPCPGADHSVALACGVVEAVLANCVLADPAAAVSYEPSTNLRVPASLECRIR